MFQLNLSNQIRKVLFYFFNSLGGALLLLIIMLPPCITQVEWKKNVYNEVEQLEIVLMVIIPFLSSIICFLCASNVKVFTKEDALRQLEQQFHNGLISLETYKRNYEHIEMFAMEKKKVQADILIQKEKVKSEVASNALKMQEELLNEKR